MIKVILGILGLTISFVLYCCVVTGKRDDEFLYHLLEEENNMCGKDEEE